MKRLWLWIVAGIVALVLLALLRKHEPPQVPVTRVKRQTLVSNLPTNGKIEPLEWRAVRAEASGLISAVPVKEGQNVPAGAVIARISQPGAMEDLAGAEARASQSRSELDTLRHGGKSEQLADIDANIAKSTFDRDVAQHDYELLQRLVQKQAATNSEVLLAKQRMDAATLSIRNLTQRRQSLVSASDIAAGRARLAAAQADQESAAAKLAIGIVRSPMAGTVYSLPARAGNYVDAGGLIANVGNLDQLRVRVFVDEPDLGRIRVGMPVHINWEGLPGRVWDGSVERLPTEIVPLGSRQVGEVWVTIPNSQRDLVPGTTVNAEVRTAVAPNALVIPKAALRRDRGPVGVYVVRGGRLAWQPIKTGTSDVSSASIVQGLKEGELVLLPTDIAVKEGDRIRPLIQ